MVLAPMILDNPDLFDDKEFMNSVGTLLEDHDAYNDRRFSTLAAWAMPFNSLKTFYLAFVFADTNTPLEG